MRVVIRVSKKDCAKAWGILVRHSAGTALPDRVFIISETAVEALRQKGVKFKEISREPGEMSGNGVIVGERV